MRTLVRASAGSGKTWRISSRIVALLAVGAAPDTIFASTFTRKAAGEILDRVLLRLAHASLDPEKARELARSVAAEVPIDADTLDTEFWQEVLRTTIRDLHRLDIGTLDRFFIRSVASYTHDLGLPPTWSVADEPVQSRSRSDALDRVLDRADPGALISMIRGLHQGHARRSVHQGLIDDVQELRAVHLDIDPEAPGWDALSLAIGEMAGDGASADSGDAAERLANALLALELPTTKKGTPRSAWMKARDRIVELIRAGAWTELASQTMVQRAGDPEPTFDRVALEGEMLGRMRDVLRLARIERGRQLAARAGAMGRLAEEWDRAYREQLARTGVLGFDDVTRLLTGSGSILAESELAYRLGGRVRHLLLDEFQDTSLLQWRALRPFGDSILEDDQATALVVADPKQSIYGWRGAAPIVVDAARERFDLSEMSLDLSWRSSAVVLDTVNSVFRDLASLPFFGDDEDDRTEAAAWSGRYVDHAPAKPLENRPGHVTLRTGPALEGGGSNQPAFFRHAAERIRDLHQELRDTGRTLGVLVRRNDTVARLILELRSLGVDASEEGGTRLIDSAAVASVLALLRLVDHPGDRLSAYHVAHGPLGTVVDLPVDADLRATARAVRDLRESLVEHGFGDTLAELVSSLRDSCSAREWSRLRQLIELGYRFDADAGLRTREFVRLAMQHRVETAGGSPVRVMTVHGSKGLQFDAVVLPELHLSMRGGGSSSAPLAWRPDPTGPVTHAFPALRKDDFALLSAIPEVLGAWRQKRSAELRDALGQLYVATTRARYALHMLIPADGGDAPSGRRSHARILREALSNRPPDDPVDPGTDLYERGTADWSAAVPVEQASPVERSHAVPTRIALAPSTGTRNLERVRPSGIAGGDRVPLDWVLGIGDRGHGGLDPRTRGTLAHACLETLDWIEDGMASDAVLQRIAARVAPELPDGVVDDELRRLRVQLERKPVRRALSREHQRAVGTEGAEFHVVHELPFLRRAGHALMEGFIDRLVLERAGDRVVSARVIDYKTDRIPEDRDEARTVLEAQAAHHRPQLEAYREAVAALYGLPPARVETLLLFLDSGDVLDPTRPGREGEA